MSADGGNGTGPATPASPATGAVVLPAGGLPQPPGSMSELRQRRLELAQRVAALTWDLGGLAYEMAIRDHFRLDVLVRRAGELQERDAELGELERVLSLREHVETGTCPDCGAVHGRGALYCWQCGKVLMERVPSAAANGGSPSEPASGGSGGDSAAPAAGEERAEEQTLVLPPGAPVS